MESGGNDRPARVNPHTEVNDHKQSRVTPHQNILLRLQYKKGYIHDIAKNGSIGKIYLGPMAKPPHHITEALLNKNMTVTLKTDKNHSFRNAPERHHNQNPGRNNSVIGA